MQFNVVFIATALLACAAPAMSTVTLVLYEGANCTGTVYRRGTYGTPECVSAEPTSAKSISYSGVPNEIQFFLPNGSPESCSNAPQLVLGSGSGCGTAPDG